ncbi:MAG: OB-fold domain-containing protein [Deltaproteobacteria bacterium]|nr:OB-fold domain-containing protein [Deltaproteobacteria bacterium]
MTRVLGDDWLLPEIDDLNREWFTRGRVCIQSCKACSEVQHPPERVCHACGASDFDWRESAGRGHIESFAVVHHPVHPFLAQQCPYTLVVVSLDDVPGINVIGNLSGAEAAAPEIGQAVRAAFERVEDPEQGALAIPQWELSG